MSKPGENKDFCLTNHIKKFRKEKHITQAELSKLTNINRNSIISIEKGTSNPQMETVCKICVALGKDIGEVFSINVKENQVKQQ